MTDQDKKFVQAMSLATDLMIEHGLGDWKVGLHKKRTTLADCSHYKRKIRFSEHFIVVATPEQFEGVTLHEIAHALVGQRHGHDSVFKRKCIEISPSSDYARPKVDVQIEKYKLDCDNCGHRGAANQVKKKYCGKCWRDKKEMVPLRFNLNDLQVVVW